MNLRLQCSSEFSLLKLTFKDVPQEIFCRFWWWRREEPFLVYRTFILLFQIGWLVSGILDRKDTKYYSFLSNWCMFYSALYYLAALAASVHSFNKRNAESNVKDDPLRPGQSDHQITIISHSSLKSDRNVSETLVGLHWLQKTTWIMQTIALDTTAIVTVTYWTIIFPREDQNEMNLHGFVKHALNISILFIDTVLVATPIRFLHVTYMIMSTSVYSLFLGILYIAQGEVVYRFLDFRNSPGVAAGVLLALDIFGSIIAHAIWFVIYHMKLAISSFILDIDQSDVDQSCRLPTNLSDPPTVISSRDMS